MSSSRPTGTARNRSFFRFSSFIKPHPPLLLLPPKPYDELYGPATVDLPSGWDKVDPFGPLWDAQSRSKGIINPAESDVRRFRSHYYGLVSHTVVVFSADHGELLDDHGHWDKRSFDEGAAKVPPPPSCPPRLPAGRICDKLVGLTDILPNSTKVGKGTTPPVVSGRSLVPLLEDDGAPWDRALFGTYGGFRGIVQMDDWRISASFMVRWQEWKYVYDVNVGRGQPFDLQEEPRELHNVAQDQTSHLVSGNFEACVDSNALLELLFQAEFQEVVVQPNRTVADTTKVGCG